MARILDQISDKVRERIPERHLLLAPADVFFTSRFTRPADLDDADLRDFAELSLESVSPFPAEQMAWGFFEGTDDKEIFCFGTPLLRLQRLGVEDLEGYYQAFPGFISVFGLTFASPTCTFLSENGALSAIFYSANNPIPEKIVSTRIDAEILSDEAIAATRSRLIKRLDLSNHEVEDGIWVREAYEITGDQRFSFYQRRISNSGSDTGEYRERVYEASPSRIWHADLRSYEFAVREAKQRAFSKKIWRALTVAGAFAAVLLLVQLLNWGAAGWIALQQAKVERQTPVVERIDNKLVLADRLVQSLTEDLQPVALLHAVNSVRPKNVYFTEAEANRFDELVVEGKASNVQAVNDYARSLEQLPYVGQVQNNPQTRQGETEFRMTINFTEIPPAPAPIAQSPAAESENGEDEAS